MLDLHALENLHADIQAVHEVVQTVRARIDGKEIGIHILRNRAGHYFYEASHYYRGADNAEPHGASENRFSTIEDAVRGALIAAVSFYRSTDEGGTWVKNDAYLH